jgi:dTDP-4-dehydrorhamnose reductase
LKNHSNNKLIVGCLGPKSTLAKIFVKQYKKKIIFKEFKGSIVNQQLVKDWLIKNKNINILINFAAITSVKQCEKNRRKALEVNCTSVIKIFKILNTIKMTNFDYFLVLSSSHVFKKSFTKLKENSLKKPSNYYGFSKLSLEKYIFNNYKKFFFKIGIARIFNYYSKNSKGFFINDAIKKFNKKNRIIKFENIKTYRDYISTKDICTAIYKMISRKMTHDFNICSGKKIFLPIIIKKINQKYKNKNIIIKNKRLGDLVGSNVKLKSKGWRISNYNVINEL